MTFRVPLCWGVSIGGKLKCVRGFFANLLYRSSNPCTVPAHYCYLDLKYIQCTVIQSKELCAVFCTV